MQDLQETQPIWEIRENIYQVVVNGPTSAPTTTAVRTAGSGLICITQAASLAQAASLLWSKGIPGIIFASLLLRT